MNKKLLLTVVVGMALVCSGSVSALWWNSTAYPYANEVYNFTAGYSYIANGSSCVCGSCYHFLAGGGQNYLAKTASGCGGDRTFANDSDELPNFVLNSSGVFGYKTDEVYPEAVLVMPFDENSGNQTTDLSGNSNTGNCTNMGGGSGHTECNWSTGRFGYGIDFDRVNDYIDCGNDATLDFGTMDFFTVEFWIYPRATDQEDYIFTKENMQPSMRFDSTNPNKIILRVAGVNLVSLSNISINTWSFITAVFNSSAGQRIYVNGFLDSSDGTTTKSASGSNTLKIGAYTTLPAGLFFDGLIDEFRVYNRSLPPEEIQEHYQNGINNRTNFGAEETSAAVTFNISINSPANETVTSDNSTSHNFTFIGSVATADCTVYYNDTSKGNNASVQNNTATVITSSEVSNGGYNWYVNCTSGSTNNQSEVYVITILPNLNIHFWVFDVLGSPILDVSFIVRNASTNDPLWSDSSDASGYALYPSKVYEDLFIHLDFPAYSAILSNVSGDPVVHINDWVSGRVRLSNSLGAFLEDQDCSVVVYDSDSVVVHDYDTRCRAGSSFVDRHGDWVSVGNCSLTDSGGWYFFKGRVDESMGFEYDQVYDLVFTCNGQTGNFSFTTSFEKSPLDMRKTEDFIRNYSGLFIIYGFFSFLCLLVLIIIIFVLLMRKS